jgi:hypothetical protein
MTNRPPKALRSLDLTQEDCRAFEHLYRRIGYRWDRLAFIQQDGDRRDYELMRCAGAWRADCGGGPFTLPLWLTSGFERIDVGGAIGRLFNLS